MQFWDIWNRQEKFLKVSPIAPPEVSARDTAELMDPGDYFNIEVRQKSESRVIEDFSVQGRNSMIILISFSLTSRSKRQPRLASSWMKTIG